MGFVKGRPIKNLLYAITHPLVAARERPLLFLLELRLRQIGCLTAVSSFGVYLLSLCLFKSGER
jgi:hypothetical protein